MLMFAVVLLIGVGCVPTAPIDDADTQAQTRTEKITGPPEPDPLKINQLQEKPSNEDITQMQEMEVWDEARYVVEEPIYMLAGSYTDYEPEKIPKAKYQPTVLFFHASWCPTCRALDKDIKMNIGDIVDGGLIILKTNYDTEKELKKKYGVTFQHTFVQVDEDGNLIKKWSGGNTLESVLDQVQ